MKGDVRSSCNVLDTRAGSVINFYAGNKWMPVTKQGRKIVLTWETASSRRRNTFVPPRWHRKYCIHSDREKRIEYYFPLTRIRYCYLLIFNKNKKCQ